MRKKIIFVFLYSLFIVVISALITTAYFHVFVLNKNEQTPQNLLISIGADEVTNSVIKEGQDIVEIISYGCHYCASNEGNIQQLEKRLSAGKKLVRLHISYDDHSGLGRYAPVFSTLEAMGIEAKYRNSAYQAVNKEGIDLGDTAQLNLWLKSNKINHAEYNKMRQSPAVKEKLEYMAKVTREYNISVTPTFIVAKKWVAIQDRPFPDFSDQLLSLLNTDTPLEQ